MLIREEETPSSSSELDESQCAPSRISVVFDPPGLLYCSNFDFKDLGGFDSTKLAKPAIYELNLN